MFALPPVSADASGSNSTFYFNIKISEQQLGADYGGKWFIFLGWVVIKVKLAGLVNQRYVELCK